jgi:chorismate mutase
MVDANDVLKEDVASAYFTTTPDLNAEFPAVAARNDFGWTNVALMCGHEMDVPGSLAMCLRILLHVNTEHSQDEIRHVYLRGAAVLRPDLVKPVAPVNHPSERVSELVGEAVRPPLHNLTPPSPQRGLRQ